MSPGSLTAQVASAASLQSESGENDQWLILHRWVLGLRWAVVALMLCSLPIAEHLLTLSVGYAFAVPILALMVIVNLYSRFRAGVPASRWIGLSVAFDLVALGAVLAASGGAANPFSAIFFVYVALAASLLPLRTTISLVILAAGVFAGLFALPGMDEHAAHAHHMAFAAHLYGMLMAFVASAVLVTYFLVRVRRSLESHAAQLTDLRRKAEEGARFAALGTLAAGTAHELATPLGTIAVLAKEMANSSSLDPHAAQQVERIRAQVDRCKGVLLRMQGATAAPGDRRPVSLGMAVEIAVKAWREAHPEASVAYQNAEQTCSVRLSEEEIGAALGILLDNAYQAVEDGPDAATIEVSVLATDSGATIRVLDQGPGVEASVQARLGEPFVTTKEPGQGMGLGLYWIRTLLEKVGGKLSVQPMVRGAAVILDIPGGDRELAGEASHG